jgi:hypothetical protein
MTTSEICLYVYQVYLSEEQMVVYGQASPTQLSTAQRTIETQTQKTLIRATALKGGKASTACPEHEQPVNAR